MDGDRDAVPECRDLHIDRIEGGPPATDHRSSLEIRARKGLVRIEGKSQSNKRMTNGRATSEMDGFSRGISE
jgi:hypothetical protein